MAGKKYLCDIVMIFALKSSWYLLQAYLETAITNPERLPQLKADIVEVFEDLFESEGR